MKKGTIILAMFLCLLIVSCAGGVQPVEKMQYESPVSSIPENFTKSEQMKEEPYAEESQEGLPSEVAFNNESTAQDIIHPEDTEDKPLYDVDGNSGGDEIYYSGAAVVLTYHEVDPEPITGIIIKPERFESDLKMLKENNFNVIPLREMISAMQGERSLPPNAVVITFDDGYEGFYNYAYPLLVKYNMPATCFIITSYAEIGPREEARLTFAGESQIREMVQSGLVDIQSHSHESHEYTVRDESGKAGGLLAFQKYDRKTSTKESVEDYSNRVINDLKTSIEIIENYTGTKSDILCFPFGHYNSRLVKLAKEAGFQYFVTTAYGHNKEGSKKIMIKRIRSGDLKLTSDELRENIIKCGRGK